MLGTDYPFPLGELQAGKLIASMDDFDDKLKVGCSCFIQSQTYLSTTDRLVKLYFVTVLV